jgi:hypothetical protein
MIKIKKPAVSLKYDVRLRGRKIIYIVHFVDENAQLFASGFEV